MSGVDILFFAEDPGAANYLDGIIAGAIDEGMSTAVIAHGKAKEKFQDRYELATPLAKDQNAAAILDQFRPRIVLVGTAVNPDSLGLGLVIESKKRGLMTVGAIDGPGSEGWRFRGRTENPLAYAPDKILVPDEATQRAFWDIGAAPETVFVCGSPHFDFVHAAREKFSKTGRAAHRKKTFPNLAADRRIVVCAPDPVGGVNPQDHVRSPEYTLHGLGTSDQRPDIFIEEFMAGLDACEGPKPYLVLRLHPRSNPEDFKADLSRFDEISQGGLVLDLLYCADLVVALTSILIVEATLLGTPSLSIVPRAKEASWLSTIEMKLTPVAVTRDEIHHLLPTALKAERHSIEVLKAAFPADCARRIMDIIIQ